MMYLESIIKLNNEVVSLMYLKEFHRALHISSCTMAALQAHGTSSSSSSCSNQETNEIDQCMMRTKINADSFADTNVEYVYEHGIYLPLETRDTAVILPILIFNSALCHHLASFHHYDPATVFHLQDKARRLYMLAYTNQQHSCNSVFRLTIINNVAGIHRRLGSEDKAKECLNCLLSSLMFLQDVGESDQELQHIQGFWSNIYTGANLAPAA